MREWQSLSHVRWYCRYHVVFVPKYRKRAIFGNLRRAIGKLLRELCVQHEIELIEGHAMADHVHLLLTPLADEDGSTYGLAEILQAVKSTSSRSINRNLSRKGRVWQDESFDRLLRSDESIRQKAEYICANPVRAGLSQHEDDYPWLWREWIEGAAS